MEWTYIKLDEENNVKRLPYNDLKGEITGKCIMGLKSYFDENPDIRKELGWIKLITKSKEEVEKELNYDSQTQNLIKSQKKIDEYTIEEVYMVSDKSEEQMLLEEIEEDASGSLTLGSFTFS